MLFFVFSAVAHQTSETGEVPAGLLLAERIAADADRDTSETGGSLVELSEADNFAAAAAAADWEPSETAELPAKTSVDEEVCVAPEKAFLGAALPLATASATEHLCSRCPLQVGSAPETVSQETVADMLIDGLRSESPVEIEATQVCAMLLCPEESLQV